MKSEPKSRPERPGSPNEPKYLEFIIFAVLAVFGSAAIIIYLAKPSGIEPLAEAGIVADDTRTSEPNSIAGTDENDAEQIETVSAVQPQVQPVQPIPAPIHRAETNLEIPDDSSRKGEEGKTDTGVAVVPDEVESVSTEAAVKTHSLTVNTAGGAILKSPERDAYSHGETVTLKAVPNIGYSFKNWSGDVSGSTNPATVTMEADKAVTANFAPMTYSLTASATDGSITRRPDRPRYDYGETVTLEAVPNKGYRFTNWSGNLSGNTNPANVVMEADKTVTASFALRTYNLIATAVDGSVTKNPDKMSYNHGETVVLEAAPNTGYSFKNWSGDLSGNTNPVAVVMEADTTVAANFALRTYTLTIAAGDGSVRKTPGRANYNRGQTVILEALPNTGYSFTNWSGDLSGNTNPATLVMDSDKAVTASFALTAKASDVVTNSIGMKLVYVPAGSFMMGSGSSVEALSSEYDEKQWLFEGEFPQHPVRISKGFWIGQTEVTQGQYESVMSARPWSGKAYVQEDFDNPAVYVSWDDAVEFCRRLSQKEGKTYRLPTEAQWEYACRAGAATQFSFGDSHLPLGDYAWFDGNADAVRQDYAHTAGQKKSNRWGIYDMHGNVFEWCSDYYHKGYYSNSSDVDPAGPESGISRSVRGGSWDNRASYLRCSYRAGYSTKGGLLVGFRVVSDGAAEGNVPASPIEVKSVTERQKTDKPASVGPVQTVRGADYGDDKRMVIETMPETRITEPESTKPAAVEAVPDTRVVEPDTVKPAVIEPAVKAEDSTAVDAAAAAVYASGNAYDILDQAAVDARSGKVNQARAALKSLLNKDKDATVMAGYELGLIHYENGEIEKAVPFFENSLSAAFGGSASGKDEQALTALLNQEEDAARIRYELGLIYQSQGKQGQAAKLFRDALSIISAKGATYIGVKKCKSCHFKQWNSWRKTKMAQTFEVLKPGVRGEEKTKLKFDPDKDYTKDPACLDCHTSGYGMPGGYIIPAEGDSEAQDQAEDNAGVTCEGCHGPGSKSVEIQEDIKENKRPYTFAELRAVGFHKAGVRSCTPCHNAGDPGKDPGYHFPYEEKREEDQHENIELKYRQD